MNIIESSAADLPAIAECFAEAFPTSFAALLGKNTVVKSLEWFLLTDNRFLFHLEQDGRVVGFLGGFAPQFIGDGAKSGMLRHSLPVAVKSLATKPSLWLHSEVRKYGPAFMRNALLRLKRRKKVVVEQKPVGNYLKCVVVATIGVHPEHQGKGYAHLLLDKTQELAAKYNRKQLHLSVKKKNASAIRAYAKSGWLVTGEKDDTYTVDKMLQ